MRPEKWVQEPSLDWIIYVKIMLGLGSELGGVRVWRAGPFFIQTVQTTNIHDFYSSSWTILLKLDFSIHDIDLKFCVQVQILNGYCVV